MKTMCSPDYHDNGFVSTHTPEYIICSYTLLVPINQRVLNKVSKEHNISDPRHTECSNLTEANLTLSLASLLSTLWLNSANIV